MKLAMKDSGVEWIGEIPAHWETMLCSQLADQTKYPNDGLVEQNLLSLSYGHIVRKNINTTEGLLPASFEGYNIIEDGDIVLRFTDLQNDHKSLRVGLATERGIITSAYCTIRPFEKSISKYLYYVLHSFDVLKGFYGMGSGVRQSLNWQEAKYIRVPVPSQAEQEAIVVYLDAKCAEIDSAIASAEASIEEYKAYRKSVIFNAVTKGLDDSALMCDSGVEWIGEIPAHWDVCRWKYLLKERYEKNSEGFVKDILSLSAAKGITPYAEKEGGGNKSKERLTDYKIARPGDIVINSMNIVSGAVGLSRLCGCISPVYYTYIANDEDKVNVEYYYDLFQTQQFQRSLFGLGNGIMYKESSTGKLNTVRIRISSDKLKALYLPVPPIDEQKEIASYLKKKCKAIDELIGQKQSIIEELKAYKKSLIFEVVTGKKEV